MERYAWSHRPLVLFAPSRDHPVAREQRKRVAAEREGFDERDMVLIEVYRDRLVGGGVTYGKPSAATMRQQFRVDADATAVILVGKDTTEKSRDPGPVLMNNIFGQIDAMPMRRDEMRRNRYGE